MSDCIQCLFFDDFGHLWIGTDLGLCAGRDALFCNALRYSDSSVWHGQISRL
ncbi:MAG: hypothetical protein KIC46_03080 [Clostridiales bacterium]|nr:hypothetical protein [Clostridiales bacterium]